MAAKRKCSLDDREAEHSHVYCADCDHALMTCDSCYSAARYVGETRDKLAAAVPLFLAAHLGHTLGVVPPARRDKSKGARGSIARFGTPALPQELAQRLLELSQRAKGSGAGKGAKRAPRTSQDAPSAPQLPPRTREDGETSRRA